jgi:arylsulfatase A-like enzyme
MLAAAAALALASAGRGADAPGPAKPNVVVFLIDDLGWKDLGCQGSPFYETPHIDRLAAQGMRFTTAYSACTVCSPTRAALLTGQYPARLHLTDWIAGHQRPYAKLSPPDWRKYLPAGTLTAAKALKSAGYVTASVGKWHLGGPDSYPEMLGFDVNVAGTHMGSPPSYFSPYRIPTLPDGPAGEYLTDRLTAEAERFIAANKDRPFFLYVPHYTVHNPLQAKKEKVAKYEAKAKPGDFNYKPVYAAMIESLDESVGRVMKALDDLKLADRTVVIFTSDNGGLLANTPSAPLRAGKGSAYEGGVRVPHIVRWPGVVAPGSTCADPVITMDVFATILDVAPVKEDVKGPRDGRSLVPLLRGQAALPERPLFWHYPHYHPGGATPYSAVRLGDWRLVEFFEDGRTELYHLGDDPGESTDLAAKHAERTAQLQKVLADWRTEVGAQVPVPNPRYDPARATQPAAKAKGKARP